MSNLRQVPVYILGLGQVGRQVVRDLSSAAAFHRQKYKVEFQIRGMFDTSGSVWDQISDEIIQSALEWKESGKSLKDFGKGSSCNIDSLQSKLESNAIVVDTSATDTTIPLLLSAIKSGAGVVLANKKPVTASGKVFQELNNASEYVGMESTVGAGTPVIACLQRLLASGDQVRSIEGALSGTLGFLATELEKGKLYSVAVEEAYRLGYTEPDPRDDLSGVDVARKALILARQCGVENIEMSDISIEPLFHPSLQNLPVSDFMEALSGSDEIFSQKTAAATANGCVLRYVARVEFEYARVYLSENVSAKITVGLQAVLVSSPLGSLSGTDNLIAFNTRTYDSSPLVIRGKGAGVEVTAAGVIADMVNIARMRSPEFPKAI